MKAIILIIFIIGIIFITTGYQKNENNNQPTKIEYRYIPRTFYEEQLNNVDLKKLYSDMFDKKSTWSTYPFNDNNEFIENISPFNN